jgi:hypothetical protein
MRFASVLVGAILVAGSAAAQSPLKRNDLVKVETASRQSVWGQVMRSTGDSLVLSDYSRVISIPAPDILSIATYDRQWTRGAVRGAKVGAIVGAVAIAAGLYFDLTECRKPGSECMVPVTAVGIGAAFYTTGIGGGIGLLTAPGGWSQPRAYR